MSLNLNQTAKVIIENAENYQIQPVEDIRSIDSKSHRLVFALIFHGTNFDPYQLSLSLIADLMGIDFYTKENAEKLIQIIKSQLALKQLNKPASISKTSPD